VSAPRRVAVVGAGLAGLAAARALVAAGATATVFEKSRGPSGRAATRRQGGLSFDHGAQYVTQRDPRTAALLAEWRAAGVVAEWRARLVAREGGAFRPVASDEPRWVGVPGMRALGEHLAAPLDVRYGVRVEALVRDGAGWRVRAVADGTGAAGSEVAADGEDAAGARFDAVLVTTPAPQAHALLAPHAPAFLRTLGAAELAPCIALMAAVPSPLPVSWDGAFVNDHAAVSWVARDASKPGRPAGGAETWVVHARPDWSAARLDADVDAVGAELLDAFAEVTGAPVHADHAVVHRWRYAIPTGDGVEGGCLWDAALGLGAAGDWCAGGRVEGALVSGMRAADRMAVGAGAR
jgi:renalase